jgi:hypothetical protein
MPPKKTDNKKSKADDIFNKKKMEIVRGFKELKAELKAVNSTAPKNVKKS